MYSTHPTLATRFSGRNSRTLRSDEPLSEDQMRAAAPSIFAEGKHVSRSDRYTYIPTIDVLRGLRKEGFEPFMVAQGSSRVEGKTEFTKHMIRMRHAGQVQTKPESNEIILINSHDGASSYQMLAGMFRFVCCNGLVVGDVVEDIRIPHRGDIKGDVIEGAFRVLDEFESVEAHADGMKALQLEPREQTAFATAALALRFGEHVIKETGGHRAAPITAEQLIQVRRIANGRIHEASWFGPAAAVFAMMAYGPLRKSTSWKRAWAFSTTLGGAVLISLGAVAVLYGLSKLPAAAAPGPNSDSMPLR